MNHFYLDAIRSMSPVSAVSTKSFRANAPLAVVVSTRGLSVPLFEGTQIPMKLEEVTEGEFDTHSRINSDLEDEDVAINSEFMSVPPTKQDAVGNIAVSLPRR